MTAMAGFEPVGENGAYPEDSMQEGYQKLLVYETWKDSFSISKEMIEDSKLMDLRKQPGAFMTSYHRTRELFGAALYGGAIKAATTAQFKGKTFDITTADGQPLFSAAHPAVGADGREHILLQAGQIGDQDGVRGHVQNLLRVAAENLHGRLHLALRGPLDGLHAGGGLGVRAGHREHGPDRGKAGGPGRRGAAGGCQPLAG